MGSGNVKSESAVVAKNIENDWKDDVIDLMKEGEVSKSLMLLKKVLVVAPTSAAYEKMADIMNEIGLYQQAKNYLTKALEKNPNNSFNLTKMGEILCFERKDKEAQKYLQKALNNNQAELQTWNLLLVSLCHSGLYKQAIQIINKVDKKREQNQISFKGKQSISDITFANFYNNSANAYRYYGNLKQSIQLYEKAIKLNDQNSLYYVNCAIAYAHPDIENYKKAYEYLVKAENLIVEGQFSEYNSHVLTEIGLFKQSIEQWNFKRAHNYVTKQERQSLSLRMVSLQNKIVDLFETNLSDPTFDYPSANAIDYRLEPIAITWAKQKFSIEGLFKIDHHIYEMYRQNYAYFVLIPFQLVIYCLKRLKNGDKLSEIEKMIGENVGKLGQKYPPSSAAGQTNDIVALQSFQLPKQQQPNLFEHKFFKSYENLMSEVLSIAKKAETIFPSFQAFIKPICLMKGHGFKSGLKFPGNADEVVQSKIMIRVAQKLFKELKDKKNELLEKVSVGMALQDNITAKTMTINFLRCWKQIITQILSTRIKNKQQTVFKIYDFVRAKCMYKNASDIEQTAKNMISQCEKKGYKIIECDNRISKGTKDFVFKIKFGQIVGELQLALQFDSALNEFNHGIYEIKRSPGGNIFGAIIWLGKLGQLNFIRDIRRMEKECKHIPAQNKQKFELRQSLEYILKEIELLK